MGKRVFKFEEGTLRCGRCAHVLPDDFQTYCSACGVTFYQVPPVTSFVLIQQHHSNVLRKKFNLKIAALSVLFFMGFWSLFISIALFRDQIQISNLKALRDVEFYTYNVEGYPALSDAQWRNSVMVGLQAFEDHFDFKIASWSMHENQIPNVLAANIDLLESKSKNTLSFWKKNIVPLFIKNWKEDKQAPLPVLLTNIPIFASESVGQMELRHLANEKWISGFANPSLVVVSSYRMFQDYKLKINSENLRARFMGEFVIAHELGHALLALNDYVVATSINKKQLRTTASILPEQNTQGCLMHTDLAGGYVAWSKIAQRSLGTKSNCVVYKDTLQAFKERGQAIVALKMSHSKLAKEKFMTALSLAEKSANPWLHTAWLSEEALFVSFIRRWTR